MSIKWKNKLRPVTHVAPIFNNLGLPFEFYEIILKWDGIHKSPFSDSIYDKEKDWEVTLPGTLRLSDHWNFISKNSVHCKTKKFVQNNSSWTLCKYDIKTDKYDIILSMAKDLTKENKLKVKAFLKDYFINCDFVQEAIRRGKELKEKISNNEVYAELQPVVNGDKQSIQKGLVIKYTKSKIKIMTEEGEFALVNKAFSRCIIELFDVKGEKLDLVFKSHKTR